MAGVTVPELGLPYVSGQGLRVLVQSVETARVINIYPWLALAQGVLFSKQKRFCMRVRGSSS